MLMLRGRGTQEARRSLKHDNGVVCLVLNDGTLLRTCQSYRHLGVILSRTEHMGPEVAARIKSMHVHYHPLARNVFLNENLSFEVKSSMANSLLWSVLFRGVGTWGPIGTCWIKKLEAARVFVLRAMFGNFRGAGDGVMTDVQVLRKAGLLPVQLQLRIERIKFAARLFGKAPEELRRLAASENGNDTDTWYGLLSQDLEHMTTVMHKTPPILSNGTSCGLTFLVLGSCWSKDLLNVCGSLVAHCMKWKVQRMLNLSTGPQTWKDCILARTVVSSSHQILDSPCTWPEFMEYEGLLHLTRGGTVHVHRVNVVFITGCDLCTTCLTRARSVWNGACCIRSL